MKDPFLEDCGGWTPAPDVLTRNSNYGFEGAYLWGRIRRLCQIGKGSYTISHGELGKRIGMSRRTVIKYLDRLIEDGYIEDLTPGVRNKAHTYSTKKGEAKILSGVQISHTESDMLQDDNEVIELEGIDVGMRNLHSDDAEIAHLDLSGMQKLPNRYAKNAHPGMQNLHLNRDSSKRHLKETKTKEYSPKQKIFLALAGICHIDLSVATDKQRGQLDQASIALSKKVSDVDLFKLKFNIYWTKIDWRGKQGQAPTPAQVREVYGDYCHWLESGEGIPIYAQKSSNGIHPANKSSPLSASQREALKQQQAQDAKEIHIPGS